MILMKLNQKYLQFNVCNIYVYILLKEQFDKLSIQNCFVVLKI